MTERTRTTLFGAVGAVVVLLSLGVAWAVSPATDGTAQIATDDRTGAGEAEAPDVEVPADEDDLELVVTEIAAFVEEERGLEFLEDPVVELADEGEFQERLLADFGEDAEDLQDFEDELRLLDLVGDDVDLEAELRELLGVGVLGFYDAETDELVVRAGGVTPLARTIIAHELVHALDDQHFDLDRPEHEDELTEVSTGFSALVEGSATIIEEAYRETLSADERADAAREETQLASGIDPNIPIVLLQLLSLPYELGPGLVEALLDEGGQEALDRAFEDPPTTSEQLLDPQRYLDGEEALEVPLPEADGEVVYEGAFGAVSLALMLGEDPYGDVVDGWGGDAYVLWRDDDEVCARGTFVGDTDEDTEEIDEALAAWVAEHPDAELERTPDGFVTFTACG